MQQMEREIGNDAEKCVFLDSDDTNCDSDGHLKY